MSARQPGVFFTINDSGNAPQLFAMDTTGADRGVWRVLDAGNLDWESAAIGPCGAVSESRATLGAPSCVYIGDTGDNFARFKTRRIYRVAEPSALASGDSGTVRSDSLRYRYSDGPHDVEAMYVAPNGDMVFISKRPLKTTAGQLRPALVFSLPANSWTRGDSAVAQLVDSLPIVPGSAPERQITDASVSRDGHHLAVRTYAEVFIFATDSATGRVNHTVAPGVCNIVSLSEPQGEGITWADNDGRLLFTSEGRKTPLILANCPMPARAP